MRSIRNKVDEIQVLLANTEKWYNKSIDMFYWAPP